MKKMNLLFSFCLLLAACNPPKELNSRNANDAATGIIGGKASTVQSPGGSSVVLIYYENESGSNICTGTLISRSAILTAAHCVVKDVTKMNVFFGLDPLNGNPIELLIVDAIPHPRYHQNETKIHHDLAIIHFAGGLPKGARPAILPLSNYTTYDGLQVVLTGYGMTETSDYGTLRNTSQVIVGDLDRDRHFGLSQRNKKGVCRGDSGGPALLVFQNSSPLLIGVASNVIAGSTVDKDSTEACMEDAYFTAVTPYLKWIMKNAAPVSSAAPFLFRDQF